MLKFIKNISLFILFSSITYIFLIVIWGEFMPVSFKKNLNYPLGSYGHLNSRINEIDEYKNVDILFIGTSHAYRGFDTRIFKQNGYNTFNLGSSAQTPIQTKILLNRYLHTLNPKVIVYGISPSTYTGDGVESSLDLIANDNIDYETFKMAINVNNIKVYNAFIYGLFRQIFHKDENFKENVIKGNDTYVSGGYVEKKISYNKHKNIGVQKKKTWKPKPLQISSFEENIKFIQKENIKLILVQCPMTQYTFNGEIDNKSIDDYFSKQGLYYNYNKLIALDDSLHFIDDTHLNQSGVTIFNKAFIENVTLK